MWDLFSNLTKINKINNSKINNSKNQNQFDKKIMHIYKQLYYNKNRIFYICSYGGSGSYMLVNYLSNFGRVFHIHSRKPPKKLTYIGCENSNNYVYDEWFNNTEIPEQNLYQYSVIYIYKNPVSAIYSRFNHKSGTNAHLEHIQCNPFTKLTDIIALKKDLYKIEDFFDNYTSNADRNYQIYCVKYEDFWDNIVIFNKILQIPQVKALYPIKKETDRTYEYANELNDIYASLIRKMNNMKCIEIV